MMNLGDNLTQSLASLRSHKLRAALTMLGLTMGVATLITVITLVQGANVYVEEKVANLGTNVFKVSRVPFTITDFHLFIKALRYKRLELDDWRAVASACRHCDQVGASATNTTRVRYQDREVVDINLYGQTPEMAVIDTRRITQGRFFTEAENRHTARVCLIGDELVTQLFNGSSPLGRVIRAANEEYTVIGAYERVGSVLGQEQDNFLVIPISSYLRLRGARNSVTLHVKAAGGESFDNARDDVRHILRARRHVPAGGEDDFFIGTNDTYIELWKNISSAFFAVFILVSSISAVVGGIVIMNVMLVSVTERTKEIGIRRAVGATRRDIRRQFLAESVMQCLLGGTIGIAAGFLCALTLRSLTAFPAEVQNWVAALGMGLSSAIGLFFGIYPAVRASRLDPVVALRAE